MKLSKNTIALVAVFGAISVGTIGCLMKPEKPIVQEPILPTHNVTESVLPKGKRIQVDTYGKLSEAECEQLIQHYLSEAGEGGQVVVMKPATAPPQVKGTLQPFCVNNLDGSPTSFNDPLFR